MGRYARFLRPRRAPGRFGTGLGRRSQATNGVQRRALERERHAGHDGDELDRVVPLQTCLQRTLRGCPYDRDPGDRILPVAEAEYEVRHQDYVMEMPQSGERFRGRENMRALQEAYPTTPPSIQVRRVLVKERLWFVEAIFDYGGGQVFDAVLTLELRYGKIRRDRWYFAEPFEAPEWVERTAS